MYGAQVETLQYGQTYPSPYIQSTTAGTTGPREYRQNLILWSELLNNSIWTKNLFGLWNTCSVIDNFDTSPNGTVTASKITAPATGSYGVLQRISVLPGFTYTVSGWVKNIDTTSLAILTYTYNNGTLVRSISNSLSYNNNWSKFSATITIQNSGENQLAFGVGLNGTDSSKSFLLWGMQIVQSNIPGDYIKSTISAINPSGAPRSLIT